MAIYGPTSLIAIVAQVDCDATRLISYLIYIPVLRIFEITNCKYQKCRILSSNLMKFKGYIIFNSNFKWSKLQCVKANLQYITFPLNQHLGTSEARTCILVWWSLFTVTHCENCGFKIFLLLRFYVKSVSGTVEVQKLPF